MAIAGKCKHCGLGPVAQDLRSCPHCYGSFPNPSAFTRACDGGVKIGGVAGTIAGLAWGLSIIGGVVGFVVGLVVGFLGGILLGLIGGMSWGAIATLRRR